MSAPGDRPLTRGEELAIILACVCFTPLVGVLAYFWWRDTSPQRARSLLSLTGGFLNVLGFVLLAYALVMLAVRVIQVF